MLPLTSNINLLTFDVEDWFHTTALDKYLGPYLWNGLESRVESNVHRILELLESQGVTATFFVLGWVAERFPQLVREIDAAGHEIASHGYYHRLIYELTPDKFREYVWRSKNVLGDLVGKPLLGYRATSFSIVKQTLWALDILKEMGFLYDSSIFPVRHDIYGLADYPRFPFVHGNGLIEIPPSTLRIAGNNFPIVGGGYFRLYPYWLTYKGIRWINHKSYPAVIYLHPWELDQNCPRIAHLDALTRFRQYINLGKTRHRLERLLKDFRFVPIKEYLRDARLEVWTRSS